MKILKWSQLKAQRLKQVRGVSFEEIMKTKLVGIQKHPKKLHQKIYKTL